MAEAICNTSPLVYLHRIQAVGWLQRLFDEVWIPPAVARELEEGRRIGHDVPNPGDHPWLKVTAPAFVPSAWLALDLGPGELEALSLALENPAKTVLLDDDLARRTAQAAGLTVWGTLRVLLEAKSHRLVPQVTPLVDQLERAGLWVSADIRKRILALAGE